MKTQIKILISFFSILFTLSAVASIEDMTLQPVLTPAKKQAPNIKAFAVFKVSYMKAEPQKAAGGIAGTAFFVGAQKAYSAYHVMGPGLFKPNQGFDSVRVWLVHMYHKPIMISPSMMAYDEKRDLAAIQFAEPTVDRHFIYQREMNAAFRTGTTQVVSEGYSLSEPFQISLVAHNSELKISEVTSLPSRRHQGVSAKTTAVSLKSDDITLDQVPSLELAYGMYRGMSGGPTLINGALAAVNSFGLPANDAYKTQAWAILLASPQTLGLGVAGAPAFN